VLVIATVDVHSHLFIGKGCASDLGGELFPGLFLEVAIPPQNAVKVENDGLESHNPARLGFCSTSIVIMDVALWEIKFW
jgi:hypothetical protein